MTASGTFGYGLEFADFVPLDELGGIIVKGTTLEHREGNDYPRMAETPSGMLNCVGLQNKGVDYFVEHIYPASMHATILFFTAKGRCFWKKVYEIPEGAKNTKGRAIQNFLNIDSDDRVNAFIRIKNLTGDVDFINSHYLLFCTKRGLIKKTLLEAYSRPRQNGVNAIALREGDGVIQVRLTNGNNEVIIANRNGRAIRFHESKVRVMGRVAAWHDARWRRRRGSRHDLHQAS